MRKLLATTAISGLIILGGCQNPDGSINAGNTLLLGAGVAAATGLAIAASQPQEHYSPRPDYRRGYGYGYGPRRPYRRW